MMVINNNLGLAFTYNEPSIWYEYVYDVCKAIKEINKDHKTVLVTNGFICEEPLIKLLPYVDALNIDLKGNDKYYKKLCFGALKDVENTIKMFLCYLQSFINTFPNCHRRHYYNKLSKPIVFIKLINTF